MNLRLNFICITAILFLVTPVLAESPNIIHGTVYRWDTFEPLNNAVVEINSTPSQTMVAKDGNYTVKLLPGNYIITVRYYQSGILTYAAEKVIKIKEDKGEVDKEDEDEADYTLDLLLFPVNLEGPNDDFKVNMIFENLNESTKSSITGAAIDKINNSNGVSITKLPTSPLEQSGFYFSFISYSMMILILFFLIIATYKFFRKQKKIERDPAQETELLKSGLSEENVNIFSKELKHNSNIENIALINKLQLPLDLQEVVDVIKSHGGQISQKNLRNSLNYSEVKVSLMVKDLEKRKRIKKIKVGRENFVFLID